MNIAIGNSRTPKDKKNGELELMSGKKIDSNPPDEKEDPNAKKDVVANAAKGFKSLCLKFEFKIGLFSFIEI